MQCSAVIPVWNEAKTVERAVRETLRALEAWEPGAEVIVVDDGSTDDTAAVVTSLMEQDPRIHLMHHDRNRGKGAAVRTGVAAAQGSWILLLDADLSVTPDAVVDFIPRLAAADLLIGSRRVAGSAIPEPQPWSRDYAGRIFNVLVRCCTGLPYRDTQCGFKVFQSSVKPVFETLKTEGWAFDVELLVRAQQAGFRVAEVPVTWRHGRDSRVRWADALNVARELISIARRS